MMGRLTARLSADHLQQARFVDHLDAQLARLVEFRSRLFACHYVVRFPAHGAAYLAACRLDALLGFFARHAGQRSCEHEGEPGERPSLALLDMVREFEAFLAQALDELAIVRLGKELADTAR